MTTCPNHPTIEQKLIPIRGQDDNENFTICGCWKAQTEMTFHRHAFRFFPGDRVYWARSRFGPLKGVTGTVHADSRNSSRPFVTWDAHCKDWAPTSFPSNFEIAHQGD